MVKRISDYQEIRRKVIRGSDYQVENLIFCYPDILQSDTLIS